MLKKLTLKNGLRVLFFPMVNTRAVTVLFLTQTGSKFESSSTNGISHLLEHLLFRGTRKFPGSSIISCRLDEIGGFYNASTNKEVLKVIVKAGSENLGLATEIVADMVKNPLLRIKDIQQEKKIVLEEIHMTEDEPRVAVFDLWEKLLYGDQPAGWPIAGSVETVRQISRADLQHHHRDFFVPRASVLALAGKINEKAAFQIIEKNFSGWDDLQIKTRDRVREAQRKPALAWKAKETDQTHFCLGARSGNLFSPEKYILAVLANALGGMMSSRIFVEVRDKKGLAYYVHTANEAYSDSGYLVTAAGVNNQKMVESVRIICREYTRLKEKRIGRAELDKAKENLRGHLRLGLETSDQFASFFGDPAVMNLPTLTPEQEWAEIAKVSQNDILKVARKVFRPERLNLAVVGPESKTLTKAVLKVLKV